MECPGHAVRVGVEVVEELDRHLGHNCRLRDREQGIGVRITGRGEDYCGEGGRSEEFLGSGWQENWGNASERKTRGGKKEVVKEQSETVTDSYRERVKEIVAGGSFRDSYRDSYRRLPSGTGA